MSQFNTKKFLKIIIYLQLLVLVTSLFFIRNDFTLAGAWMGKFAIYVFWLIAIAGILQRYKVQGFLKKVQNVLLPNRRQLGILMFVLAYTHYMWNKGFSIILNGIPSSIPLFQIFGFIALVLLFPLLLTSNNYSVKKLGKMWKVLHRIVYPVMFLLVLHTAMQGKDFQLFGLDFGIDYTLSYAIPSFVILIVQIASHFKSFKIGKSKLVIAKVSSIQDNTSNAKTITLELSDKDLQDFIFTPGQHISLSINIDSKNYKRSYSICDDSLEGNKLRIAVKQVQDGLVSKYLNQKLQIGEQIEISKPFGGFFNPDDLKSTIKEVALWAGGSGITPMMSIIKYITKHHPDVKIKLFYANSNPDSIMFDSELKSLINDNFHIIHIISKGDIQSLQNKNIEYINDRLNPDLMQSLNFETNSSKNYICGPQALIQVCQQGLVDKGVKSENIHVEIFNKKQTGRLYGSGQVVPESGEYLCVDCGHIESYEKGQVFKYCQVCLAGQEDSEYEFWQKI